MKRLMRYVFLTLALILGVTACKKYEYEEPQQRLKVIKTTADFAYTAGKGQIEVSEEGCTARSEADWITVTSSGARTFDLSIQENKSFEGRTASIVISKGEESVRIPISQVGTYDYANVQSFTIDHKGGEQAFSANLPSDPQVKISEDWLTYEITADKISFKALPLPAELTRRSATVTIKSGLFERAITVKQVHPIAYSSLIGVYTIEYSEWSTDPRRTAKVELVKDVEGKSYRLKGLAADIIIRWDAENSQMQISPQSVANGQATLYAWIADNDGYFTNDTNYKFVSEWDRSQPNYKFRFLTTDTIMANNVSYPVRGFIFWVTGKSDYKGADGKGISRIVDFTLTKN